MAGEMEPTGHKAGREQGMRGRASNSVYEMPEGRPIWKTIPVRLGITAVLLVLLAASAVMVVFTGDLASWRAT